MTRALVTGGSGGIGLAIASRLADEGFQLTLVARNGERLKEIVASLTGTGHDYIRADLASQPDIDRLSSHIAEQKYDVLVNNAGVGLYGRFEETPLDQQMDMLTLNCNALVSLSYAFLKRAESGDTLVNIASVLGITSLPGAATYVGTKGFVILFSESLWYEYKKRGIHVMAFCPGITSSNFYESSGGIEGNYPGILVQTPEQVAKDVVRAIGKRNRPVVIGGIKNALGVFSTRFASRKLTVNIMGRFSHIMRAK